MGGAQPGHGGQTAAAARRGEQRWIDRQLGTTRHATRLPHDSHATRFRDAGSLTAHASYLPYPQEREPKGRDARADRVWPRRGQGGSCAGALRRAHTNTRRTPWTPLHQSASVAAWAMYVCVHTAFVLRLHMHIAHVYVWVCVYARACLRVRTGDLQDGRHEGCAARGGARGRL